MRAECVNVTSANIYHESLYEYSTEAGRDFCL